MEEERIDVRQRVNDAELTDEVKATTQQRAERIAELQAELDRLIIAPKGWWIVHCMACDQRFLKMPVLTDDMPYQCQCGALILQAWIRELTAEEVAHIDRNMKAANERQV